MREELDTIVRAVLLVYGRDEAANRALVIDQLRLSLDDHRLIWIVGRDCAPGTGRDVPCLSRGAARAEPQGLVEPDGPHRHEMRLSVTNCCHPVVVRAFQPLARPSLPRQGAKMIF